MNEKQEAVQFHAEQVLSSEILGLVEAKDLVFIGSSDIIINPEDDKVRKIFKDTTRTMLPISSIVRIDEVVLNKSTPVLRLYDDKKDS